ncbi:hypothetical protein ACJMK2_040709 [Sinanodonta woodiana]|uniref:Sushi, von Willebrand factor type A, EGF and pentraxin domain-containing protein 1 n=1 Tax=Sinanodonta woodiana TaxID=1069815 RepID=A0ABD3W4P8_SINWO
MGVKPTLSWVSCCFCIVYCLQFGYVVHGLNNLENDERELFDYGEYLRNPFSKVDSKKKIERLGAVLKGHIKELRMSTNKQIDLIFLVDSSTSVGKNNFIEEVKFVKKLLSDFTVDTNHTRVSVITFSSRERVTRQIDYLNDETSRDRHKCSLLEEDLPKITYSGGGTFTLGAFLEAKRVLNNARPKAQKVVILVTDGFSNGGDPRPQADALKEEGVKIFTFGIQNGNVRELYEMASEPKNESCYILDSFEEFEALARRALHEDLNSGRYIPQAMEKCDRLCVGGKCCDPNASCLCGIHTGKYECVCPPGHYGNGLKGGCQPCPAGTYKEDNKVGDINTCKHCPDENHSTDPGAISPDQCVCKKGYRNYNGTGCKVLTCPQLPAPSMGYFVNGHCNNVFNAACGLKCKPGYGLRGSSLRICQEEGTWTGFETECVMKTCPALMIPKNGNMICSADDFSFNTTCRFTCDTGYKLVGARKRTCLAVAYWTGITTRCRVITCKALPVIRDGSIYPAVCTENDEVSYGTTCSITCRSGYTLIGPHSRQCLPNGMWTPSMTTEVSQCVDTSSPFIMCPYDINIVADVDSDTAEVKWEVPLVVDNSGYVPVVTTTPAVVPPAMFPIGSTKVTYIAEDLAKNREQCSFYVHVKDYQPPRIDRCHSPLPVVSPEQYANVSWEEPLFSDNSGQEVKVERSHSPGLFSTGKTIVTYIAHDKSGNNSTCTIEINVIPHPCEYPSTPVNGNRTCTELDEGVVCRFACMEDYAFAIPPAKEYICAYDNIWEPRHKLPVPDCSVRQLSNDVVQPASLTFTGSISCKQHSILNQMESRFEKRVSQRVNELCEENVSCNVDKLQTTCVEENELNRIRVVLGRRKRNTRRVKRSDNYKFEKLEPRGQIMDGSVTFDFNLEGSVSTTGNPQVDNQRQHMLVTTFKRVIESLKDDAKQGHFNLEISGKQLELVDISFMSQEPKFMCKPGSVLINTSCVHCPVGAFFNVVSEQCESCPKGTFQPQEGQISCLICPNKTSTTSQMSRSQEQCKVLCLPGSFSETGLDMCETCHLGFYQSGYGQKECIPCPVNTTTIQRGSRKKELCQKECEPGYVSKTGLEPCFPCPKGSYQDGKGKKSCFECPGSVNTYGTASTSLFNCEGYQEIQGDSLQEELLANECLDNPCKNGGTCYPKSFGFECECPPGYAGVNCENDVDDCEGNPCLNEGKCRDLLNDYLCDCLTGYEGKKCEINIDDCKDQPCQSGGTCIDQVNGYICRCENGFSGQTCEININDCLENPCVNDGTCIDEAAGYRCVCPSGIQGINCEINNDECASGPCLNGGTCADGIGNFSCSCPPGFQGRSCEIDINECDLDPCGKGGKCEDLPGGFKCHCPTGFKGKDCAEEIDIYFQLDFPSTASTTDYAKVPMRKDLTAASLCFWMKSDDTLNQGTPFSYASPDGIDNAFTLTDYDGFAFYVNGAKVSTSVKANDGLWHHICVIWSSERGTWKIYMDGGPLDDGHDLANGQTIKGGGEFIIGQEQDSLGGDFSSVESFIGQLTQLNMWDYELPLTEIESLRFSCKKKLGNVIAWSDVTSAMKGSLSDSPAEFCKECPIPSTPAFGKVVYNGLTAGSTANYECLRGFHLSGPGKRLCLVTGEWEDIESTCQRAQCGFPGNIDNGYFTGQEFTFDNRVSYKCNRGFRLVGSRTRYCNEAGVWVEPAPVCERITCVLPLLSENTRIINPKTTPYLPLEQALFECTAGNKMYSDHNSISCQTDGTWDKSIPSCDPQTCKKPPTVINAQTTEDLKEFPVGFVITYQCGFGYAMSANSINPTGQISCLPSGEWEANLPECVVIECPVPQNIPNADLDWSQRTFLSQIRYSCHEGYRIQGHDLLECFEDGNWNPNPPECLPVNCGRPADIKYGTFTANGFTFQEVSRYQCDLGYKLVGPSERQCLQNGSWSGESPVCKPISCGKPDAIEHGRVTGRDFTLGKSITYLCDEGYTLVGISERICRETGKWQNDPPSCIRSECGPPPNIDHGFYIGKSFFYGDTVQYQCEAGYKLGGQAVVTCAATNEWFPFTVSCTLITCLRPSSVENGNVIVYGTNFNDRVEYRCYDGYEIQGDAFQTCTINETWSGSAPRCEAVKCFPPIPIANGRIDYKDLKFGSVVRYMCNTGFRLVGPEIRRCMANLSWSEAEPQCVPVACDAPPNILFGQKLVTGLTYQSTVTYSCEIGYVLKGEGTLTCTKDRTWSGVVPQCEPVQCNKPSAIISNGRMIGNIFSFGANISYVCDEGYRALGSVMRTCQANGEWDNPIPVCEIVNCPPPKLTNGFPSGFQTGFGTTITFTCKKGYRLDGSSIRTCQASGLWSGEEPVCIRLDCGKLQPPVNGQVLVLRGKASYQCYDGFYLVGLQERECQDDQTWSGQDPLCEPKPCEYATDEPFPNGSLNYTSLTFGSYITYLCNEGYERIGNRQRECLIDGTWSGSLPRCQKVSCNVEFLFTNGVILGDDYTYGAEITYKCNIGYRLIGESVRRCLATRVFSGFQPTCEIIRCPIPPEIDYGTIKRDTNSYGSSVVYSCIIGFEIVGESTLTCLESGKWSSDFPSCIKIHCGPPAHIENGRTIGSDYSLGSIIQYSCNPGFELKGDNIQICMANKRWTGSNPTCQKISCGVPSAIKFGSYTGDKFSFGDTVEFVCNEGYQVIGESRRICQQDKHWSGTDPLCAPIYCGPIPVIPNGYVNLTSPQTFGTLVELSCELGFKGLGTSSITCQSNGIWSQTDFLCEKITCPPLQVTKGKDVKASDFGTEIVLQCDEGFQAAGRRKIQCLSTGYWNSDEAPECVEITCKEISFLSKQFQNGHIRGTTNKYGSEITYFCDELYELVGPSKRVCTNDGNWSGVDPFCTLIACSAPPVVPNSLAVDLSRQYVFRDVVQYVCDTGYTLVGNGSLLCDKSGEWTGTIPSCRKITCGTPKKIFNGRVSTTGENVLNTATYTCFSGFVLRGNSVSTCLESGEWSGSPPSCSPVNCGAPPPVKNAVVVGSEYTFGNVVTYICDEGYLLSGERMHECEADGRWSGKGPICTPVSCGTAPTVHHAFKSGTGEYFKSTVYYICEPGYELVGNNILECGVNGAWVGSLPKCIEVNCGPPPVLPHSTTLTERFTFGSVATYDCNDGYYLAGRAEIRCGTSKQWEYDASTECRPVDCGRPTAVPHALVTLENTTYGSTAVYSCEKGYILQGSSGTLKCDEMGNWKGKTGNCEPISCGAPLLRDHLKFSGSFTFGETITFTCDDGYVLAGNSELRCEASGHLSGAVPSCSLISCGPPPHSDYAIVGGTRWDFGSSIEYTCQTGFKLVGKSTLNCEANGQWSGTSPQCLRTSCEPLRLPKHGFIVQGDPNITIYYGDTLEFECEEGYQLFGNRSLTCLETRSWSSPIPDCLPVIAVRLACRSDVGVPHSKSLNKTVGPGSTLTVECESGYVGQGDMSSTCLPNRDWAPVKGHCERVFCGKPVLPDMINVVGISGRAYFYGDKIRYKCRPGVPPARPDSTITCTETGEWDGVPACGATCKMPCENGGTCLGLNRCKCPNGFGGSRCQKAICILPCLNGGWCVAPYRCDCPIGYTGVRCQTAICAVECKNGGRCIKPNVCECYDGYQRPYCESKKPKT